MPTHLGSGVLIAIEGIDGAGKTTQAALLASILKQANEPYTASKEPTNGNWGAKIREAAAGPRLEPREELKLFLKDREEHTKALLKPALEEGKIVIVDRYYYSTIAYQGARGFQVDDLQRVMEERFIIPDAVFLLDIDPELSLPRIRKRGDIPNEFEKIDSLKIARELFTSLKDHRIIRIDGSMSIEAVHSEIVKQFINGPLKARRCAKDYGCDDPFHCTYRLTNTCPWVTSSARLQSALAVQ